jgi:Ca2+-binding RTX toxin-like protein
VTLRVTDGDLTFDKLFTIAVANINEAPTGLTVSNVRVNENSAGGTVVGTISATDPDASGSFTYALQSDPDAKFQVVGNQLQVRAGANVDYETKTSHQVTLRVTDQGGLIYDKLITVSVNNIKAEKVKGTVGKDVLRSGSYNDTLDAGAGNDMLFSGSGRDTLKGGKGKDTFVFDSKGGVDTIVDFSSKDDTIRLAGDAFSSIRKGKLDKDAFFEGKMAHDVVDRIIYDKSTGNLYYDADGVGGAAQIRIAILSHKPSVSAHDFHVI